MNLIFDIGYNHGRFTDACFNKYPSTQVVALEANPNLCDKPNEDNFVLLNRVVSNIDNEYIDFYIEHGADGISTASENWINNSRFAKGSKYITGPSKWSDAIKVPSITLDTLIEAYGTPDLMKIDVEGYELTVLTGLNKKAKDICFEWSEELYDDLEKIVSHLQSIEYTQFGVIGYFDDRDLEYDTVTHSDQGDPYLVYPNKFYTWEKLNFKRFVEPERRVNYGMFFAK
jgi:FkbM family methyltransferase